MVGGTAGFAHVGGAGAWLSGSRQFQRAAAVAIGMLLTTGLARVSFERRSGPAEQPIAMAATVGVFSDVQAPSPAGRRPAAAVSRNRPHRPRVRAAVA
ncbi:MAG: hypothetical protein JWP02_636, partial [Acidimicrobiales bacterium]|nr:hypothetical protein [Acidimicrobiales bacterium]